MTKEGKLYFVFHFVLMFCFFDTKLLLKKLVEAFPKAIGKIKNGKLI